MSINSAPTSARKIYSGPVGGDNPLFSHWATGQSLSMTQKLKKSSVSLRWRAVRGSVNHP